MRSDSFSPTLQENLTKKERFEVSNISRWFDFIQHSARVDLGKPLIHIDLDEEVVAKKPEANEPKEVKEVKEPKEPKEAKAKADQPAKKEQQEKEKEVAAEEPSKEGKGKGKGKGKEVAPAAAPKAEDEEGGDTVDVSRLNLKVGRVLEVQKHSGADSLYVEKIDIGEDKPRNVVSGLVKFMTMEEIKDRLIIVVSNMKPSAMRGVTSEAMVLCASTADGTKTEFVEPPAGSQPGDKVFIEGHDAGAPDAVLNPKKKIFEKIQPEFKTSEEKIATYKGKPFKTQQGVCTVKSIIGGNIK